MIQTNRKGMRRGWAGRSLAVVLITLLALGGGCVTTAQVLNDAAAKEVEATTELDIIRDSSGRPAAAAQYVLSSGGGDTFHAEFPLSADGMAPYPFGYRRVPERQDQFIRPSADQLLAVAAARPVLKPGSPSRSARRSGGDVRSIETLGIDFDAEPSTDRRVRALVVPRYARDFFRPVRPALLVPATLPRPDAAAARASAVVLTPFALAADVILAPVRVVDGTYFRIAVLLLFAEAMGGGTHAEAPPAAGKASNDRPTADGAARGHFAPASAAARK